MRNIIFHYHLFKNAGTSVDAILRENFGEAWVTREFPPAPNENRKLVRTWVNDIAEAACFSSHTAILPPPLIPGTKVWPIIFVRHPLDRIASAYAFEIRQADSGLGSILAKNTSLRGYIEVRLAIKNDRQCRNFHSQRLSQMYAESAGPEEERAKRCVNELPFVGLVEEFEESVNWLESWLRPTFPNFARGENYPAKNATPHRPNNLKERLLTIRDELGDEAWMQLISANETDLQLYDIVRERYGLTPMDLDATSI